MPADLNDLLARVRRCTGPDREIDLDLCIALSYSEYTAAQLNLRRSADDEGWLDYECVEDGKTVECTDLAPELTASIDAALALVERKLGVYSLKITIDPSGNGAALTWWPDGLTGGKRIQADEVSVDPVLAILAALLSALLSLSELSK